MPATTILEAPTIRSLAARVEARDNRSDNLVMLRAGGPTPLFLVHDGYGETLLYRGLARRLPKEITVYGVMSRTLDGIPLPHTSIEAMAADYLGAIRAVQPAGPYYVGGLCMGATIAFEMAVQLESVGETAGLIALFDAASPAARRKPSDARKRRLSRVHEIVDSAQRLESAEAGLRLAQNSANRAGRVARHELERRVRRVSSLARFKLLGALLERGRAWPGVLRSPSFRDIAENVESRYEPGEVRHSRAVLFSALEDSAPSAFRHLYHDADLGWQRHAGGRLELVDVPGNHASMLQEPHVDRLAERLSELLPPSR